MPRRWRRGRGAAPTYEVYAVKYAGPFTSKLAFLYFNEGWDQDIDRYYYVGALKGNGEVIVVDTGVGVSMAGQRKLRATSTRWMS